MSPLSTGLCTLMALLLPFTSSASNYVPESSDNLKHLANIEKSMDRTADPCDNFHQYACGSVGDLIGNVGLSDRKYFADIDYVLEQYPITGQENQHYAEKIRIYTQAYKKAQNVSLLKFLDEVKPGPGLEWPFLEELHAYTGQGKPDNIRPRLKNDIDLIDLLGELFGYGLNNVLLKYHILRTKFNGKDFIVVEVPEPTTTASNELMKLLSSLKLPRYLVNKYYYEFVETHQYWQSIYNEYLNIHESGIGLYHQLKADSGVLSHLAKFLKKMLPHPAKIEEHLLGYATPYLKYLFTKQWQPDEARKLCNYFMFQFLLYLQDTAQPLYSDGSSYEKLKLGLNYMYYKHFYLPHKKEHEEVFNSTVRNLYKHLLETVAENRLNLNEQQAQEVTEKLDSLRFNIGNLPENITESMVEEHYSTLPDLDVNNIYKNELLVRKHSHLEVLTCPDDMVCFTSEIHPFYSVLGNVAYFPLSAFVSPLHHWSWHPLFAMSILASNAGHELVHSIDTSNLNRVQLFPSFNGDSLQVPSINASITCLSQQNPTAGSNINERLADVIGAQLAFETYSREFGLQPDFTTIPWQQLYFLSLANFYCGTGNSLDTVHDPLRIRLHEIVMNSKEFAEAFQCPAGSKMNPVKKCRYI